ncbi:MAG TPA: phosphatidate cytidylyltransferase [Candidatus Thermoplasmatota archaeon]|nr:phosphatidate cytidylyltransferase [Candidatus Thermoplasmatota archaeon]
MAVEPVQFAVGWASRSAALFLAGGTVGYAALTALYTVRAFRHRLEDRWSAAVASLAMLGLAYGLFEHGADLLPAPFGVGLVVVFVGAIALTVTYTLGRYQEKIARFQATFGDRLNQILARSLPEDRYEEWQRLLAKWTMEPEQRRKMPHLLMGLFLAVYLAVGALLLRGLWELSRKGPVIDREAFNNLHAATHATEGAWLVGGQTVGLFGMLLLLYCILPTEFLRLRYPELSYPFKAIITSRLRKRENGLFGAHYYLAASTPLLALWMTRDPTHWDVTIYAVLAVLCVSVFADAASALVGTSLGKRKWFHNPGKSYLGSLGGTGVAFALVLPFVGLPMAVVTAAVFLVVDILAPVPFSVSDNLLNPIVLGGVYIAMQGHLDPWLPYY